MIHMNSEKKQNKHSKINKASYADWWFMLFTITTTSQVHDAICWISSIWSSCQNESSVGCRNESQCL